MEPRVRKKQLGRFRERLRVVAALDPIVVVSLEHLFSAASEVEAQPLRPRSLRAPTQTGADLKAHWQEVQGCLLSVAESFPPVTIRLKRRTRVVVRTTIYVTPGLRAAM